MRRVECSSDAATDVYGEFGAESLLIVEQLTQAFAVDELHHDGLASIEIDRVVDRNDVGVRQPGHRNDLSSKALDDHRVSGQIRFENLDCNLA